MNAPPNTPQAAAPAEPKLAVVFLRMPPALKQRIESHARREKKSINAFALEMLLDTIDLLDVLLDESPGNTGT